MLYGPQKNYYLAFSCVSLSGAGLCDNYHVVVVMFFFFILAQCGVRWYKVYENDANGEPVFGYIGDLRAAVLNGANIRIATFYGSIYMTSVQNLQIVDGNVFAQALFHVSKNGL